MIHLNTYSHNKCFFVVVKNKFDLSSILSWTIDIILYMSTYSILWYYIYIWGYDISFWRSLLCNVVIFLFYIISCNLYILYLFSCIYTYHIYYTMHFKKNIINTHFFLIYIVRKILIGWINNFFPLIYNLVILT